MQTLSWIYNELRSTSFTRFRSLWNFGNLLRWEKSFQRPDANLMVLHHKRTAPLRIGAVSQMLGHGTVYPSQIISSQRVLESRIPIIGKYKDTRFKWPPLRWRQNELLFFMGRVFVNLRRSSLALSSDDHLQTNFMVIYESVY